MPVIWNDMQPLRPNYSNANRKPLWKEKPKSKKGFQEWTPNRRILAMSVLFICILKDVSGCSDWLWPNDLVQLDHFPPTSRRLPAWYRTGASWASWGAPIGGSIDEWFGRSLGFGDSGAMALQATTWPPDILVICFCGFLPETKRRRNGRAMDGSERRPAQAGLWTGTSWHPIGHRWSHKLLWLPAWFWEPSLKHSPAWKKECSKR